MKKFQPHLAGGGKSSLARRSAPMGVPEKVAAGALAGVGRRVVASPKVENHKRAVRMMAGLRKVASLNPAGRADVARNHPVPKQVALKVRSVCLWGVCKARP